MMIVCMNIGGRRKWRFNLSRAPWWGGQFERLIVLIKNCLYKTVGSSLLNWCEMEDVLLDIEITSNNRPLTYLEDDILCPVLTPNIMLRGIPVKPLDEVVDEVYQKDIMTCWKCSKVQKCSMS